MVTGQGLEDSNREILEMLERRPQDRRAADYLTVTKWTNMRIGMTTMPDILAVHRSNTQFCREIHAILPREDGGVEAGVPATPALVPRIAHRSRADEFTDQEVRKKLRVVFDRAFNEMWGTQLSLG